MSSDFSGLSPQKPQLMAQMSEEQLNEEWVVLPCSSYSGRLGKFSLKTVLVSTIYNNFIARMETRTEPSCWVSSLFVARHTRKCY